MGKLNMDAMKEKLNSENNSRGYNAEYDSLQAGKNVRRVLWPKGESDSFYSEGYLHFGLGDNGKTVVTCPKTFNSKEKCPICEYVEELQKSKNKDDKKLANDIKAKRRIFINVINRDDDEDETPKVLPIGVTILKGLLETICDADYGDITDYEDGRDVTITRKGKGLQTEYTVLPKPNASVASDTKTLEELEDEMADLDKLFVKKSYEELEAILNGEDVDTDSESEDGNEDEDEGYESMDGDELEELCKERGIKLPAKYSRLKLVKLLNEWDEANTGEDSEETTYEDDSEDDNDDVQSAIAAAIARRKNKK